MTDAFGYLATAALLATIGAQIRQQWKSQSTKGVSPWLFIGQIAASIGFVIHSAIIGSGLFVVTNVLVGAAAIVGMVIYVVLRKRGSPAEKTSAPTPDRADGVVDPACARIVSRGLSSPLSVAVEARAKAEPEAPAQRP